MVTDSPVRYGLFHHDIGDRFQWVAGWIGR